MHRAEWGVRNSCHTHLHHRIVMRHWRNMQTPHQVHKINNFIRKNILVHACTCALYICDSWNPSLRCVQARVFYDSLVQTLPCPTACAAAASVTEKLCNHVQLAEPGCERGPKKFHLPQHCSTGSESLVTGIVFLALWYRFAFYTCKLHELGLIRSGMVEKRVTYFMQLQY